MKLTTNQNMKFWQTNVEMRNCRNSNYLWERDTKSSFKLNKPNESAVKAIWNHLSEKHERTGNIKSSWTTDIKKRNANYLRGESRWSSKFVQIKFGNIYSHHHHHHHCRGIYLRNVDRQAGTQPWGCVSVPWWPADTIHRLCQTHDIREHNLTPPHC
jgi:hypothetical protein